MPVPIHVSEATTVEELEQLRPEWSDLADRCPWATAFQLPEWQLPWWHHLGGGELLAVVLRCDGRLVGFAPLFVHGFPWEPRELSLLAAGVSDYEDFLLEPEIATEGTELILQHIAGGSARGSHGDEQTWSTCDIPELRAVSPLVNARVPATLSADLSPSSTCPVLQLPTTNDELQRRLPSRFRRKLRMVAHRLERSGNFEYVRADPSTTPALMDTLFKLHEQRWNAQDQPGVLTDPRLRNFHDIVAAGMMSKGKLRLYALRLNGDDAAVFYGFAHAGRMYSYLTGIDPSAGYYSPGTNLLHHVISEAISEGMQEFDMLRGEEPYKYLWGAVARQNQRLTMRHIPVMDTCTAPEQTDGAYS